MGALLQKPPAVLTALDEATVAAGNSGERLTLLSLDSGEVVQVGTLLEVVLAAVPAAAASATAAVDTAVVAAGKAAVERRKNGPKNPAEVVRVEPVLENLQVVPAAVPVAASARAVAAWIVSAGVAGLNNSPKDPAWLVRVRVLLGSQGRDLESPERFL
mmetsp:Transcript_54256/g.127483  ORF Transcript_54256/g.127483 Transcript_54256/m.127483 type:complete len:159 (+) Transcript_54256:230-706(+)